MATTKMVDSSLWWDPFTDLLTELETASVSSDLPPKLVKKLEENRSWLVETVSRFKPPNEKSKEALNSQIVKVGDHQLSIKHELKDQALKISSNLCLDEVQSYILVERSQQQHNLAFDSIVSESIHVILLQYYIERQCLLKCTRRIFMHALYIGGGSKEANAVSTEALKLITDGLEGKLISVLQDLLSSTHPVEMDIDLFNLWAEETLIEDSLALDILFLLYYESFCTCNGEKWKKLCSLYKGILSGAYNFGKLAISSEALKSSFNAKIQLLLILIETLDLENLLQMVHDETPFSQGTLVFSLNDIQEIDDALLSTLDAFEMKEAGPLLLAWAVFLCLISSLPGKEDTNVLMEIDHAGYVCQAFEAKSLNSFLEILQNDLLQEYDGPAAGYRSVLRTFVSAFIASYEISLQLEDGTLNLILHIVCKIYRGEESLCSQFWDKESFVDGPIRCFLSNLESEFPFRTVELVRFLSSLAEGSWPAECVYNFLNKSVGISTLFEISNETLVDSKIVETPQPLHVLGVEGLLIPSKIRGHILKVFGGNTALVRWEYNQSAVLVLLLRLAQELYTESSMEAFLILDLFSRMVSFNMAIRFALMNMGNSLYAQGTGSNEQIEKNVWVAEIICTLIRDLSPNSSSAAIMSMGINILAKMLKCSPSLVTAVALKANIFDVASRGNIIDIGSNDSTSGWLLSGKLAKMLLMDSEQNDYDCPLTISVLDFTMQLVETGLENDFVLALVVFALQYILVNHEYWKYKVKNVRWKVTLKVLEVMKTCIISTSSSGKLGEVIRGMLLCDSSIHSTLFRIVCSTKETLEKLYVIRTFELMEIEGLHLAIGSVLDILYTMLSKFLKEMSSILPVFHRAVLSSTSTPIPVVAAVVSLISYFRYPAIQAGATRVLSMLLTMSDYSQPCLSGNACFGLDDKQIADLRHSVDCMLQSVENEDLFIASINLLTSAAQHQPAFLIALFSTKESVDIPQSVDSGKKHPANDALKGPQGSKRPSMVVALLLYVERYDDLINSNPRILLNVLNFLKALWQGAGQYADILEWLKSSGKSWKQLSNSFSLNTSLQTSELENTTEMESQSWAYKYQCQSAILEIMAHDIFLKQRLLHAESLVKQATESKGSIENTAIARQTKSANDFDFKEILSNWFQSPVLGTLIKSYTTCAYDNEILFRAKAAVSLLTVHMIGKLATGDVGSLSVSLLEKVRLMSKKLTSQTAFSQLLQQYSQRRYSEGKELKTLILSDLYCHLQGEFEGRKISPGPFRELSQYLIESKFLQSYEHKYAGDLFAIAKDVYMFDPVRVRADLGLDMWDYLEWGASKVIAETMLHCMQEANSMLSLATSKLSALKALVTVLTVYEDDSLERNRIGGNAPDQLSHFDQICQNFHATVELLALSLDAPTDILDFLAAQAELLVHLVRSVQKSLSSSVCVLVLKTSVFSLKVLSDMRVSAAGVNLTIKHLLMLLLSVMESTCLNSLRDRVKDNESVGDLAEVSNVTLGLLPILCHCITNTEHCTLSLTVVDLVMRSLLTPNTWFPIIQQHLQLRQVIHKFQDKNSFPSISTILKFFLTLARVRGGAEMLLNAGFFSSLRVLLSELLDGGPSSVVSNDKTPFNVPDKTEKLHLIWGLGLAVVAAMVHSLGDSFCKDIVNNVIPYFFLEKAYLISYYLNAPEFPSDDHDKKRPRAQRTQTSLTSLKETEHTLMLMCVLAKHWSSWVKAMKEMDSQLREVSIHLLAFISRGTHRIGESASRMAPLLCPPILKEELDWFKKPSIFNSKNGWFSLTPLGCGSKTKFSAASATIVRDQTAESSHHVSQTYFSDAVAVQIYRITFLLLKFLCLQAKGAAERAEEVGFVDLAHFPELPMPELLHGLQDQVVAIVTELCEANKSKQIDQEIRLICLLLLQVMEMALNLELCVVQICGIRPVLGRVEDFSREVKLLIKATEKHVFLKASMKSLEHTISIVYPGLL